MSFTNVMQYFELLFIGLLAGFELAVHYGFGAPPPALPEASQIVLRQAIVRRLRILAPLLFLPSFVLAVILAIRKRPLAMGFRYTVIAMLLIWIVIRIVRTVPVNSATLEWNPEAPPANWRSLVASTERFHIVAAWAAVFAFMCSLASAFAK